MTQRLVIVRMGYALTFLIVMPWSCVALCQESTGTSCCTFEAEGRIEYDYNRYRIDVADLGNGEDSLGDVRRVEIGLSGKFGKNLKWATSYDFKADNWMDAYLKYSSGGQWTITAGQFKQPQGMEELSSARTGDFISKSSITNMLGLSRRMGVAYELSTGHIGIATSVFGRSITWHGNPADPNRGYALRGYWTPVRSADQTVHLGFSYTDVTTHGNETRLRARPNADLTAVRLVDTGVIDRVDRQSTSGVELMWLSTGMKLEAQLARATVRRQDGLRDFNAHGAYVSGVWNLTGEAWAYRNGVPVTPKPAQPVRGLWQAGVRYDWVDLDDGYVLPPATPAAVHTVNGTLGGTMDIWTAGVSVYLRSHLKFMLNYVSVSSDRYDPDEGVSVSDNPAIVEARVQVYW